MYLKMYKNLKIFPKWKFQRVELWIMKLIKTDVETFSKQVFFVFLDYTDEDLY